MSTYDPWASQKHHPSPIRSTSPLYWFDHEPHRPVLAAQSIVCLDDAKSVACAPVSEAQFEEWADIVTYGMTAHHVVVREPQPQPRGWRRMMGRRWERRP